MGGFVSQENCRRTSAVPIRVPRRATAVSVVRGGQRCAYQFLNTSKITGRQCDAGVWLGRLTLRACASFRSACLKAIEFTRHLESYPHHLESYQ